MMRVEQKVLYAQLYKWHLNEDSRALTAFLTESLKYWTAIPWNLPGCLPHRCMSLLELSVIFFCSVRKSIAVGFSFQPPSSSSLWFECQDVPRTYLLYPKACLVCTWRGLVLKGRQVDSGCGEFLCEMQGGWHAEQSVFHLEILF